MALISDWPFIVRGITPEGIYISSEQEPDRLSFLIFDNNQWQVYMYDVPHTIVFKTAPIDRYSDLPPEIILKTAIYMDKKTFLNMCTVSRTFNNTICNNDFFFRQKFLYDYGWTPEDYKGSWKELYINFNSVYAFKYDIPQLIKGIQAQQVSAGEYHSLILDLWGNVYAFGNNDYGQLGLRYDIQDYDIPQLIKRIPEIKQVAAGEHHSLLLDLCGDVWAFGDNKYGQLGLGNNHDYSKPTLIEGMPPIKEVSAGVDHSLLLDQDGNVWSFGHNEDGQLGLGDNYNRNKPNMISNIKASQVSAGGFHSLILDVRGNVWAFGYNEYGQLGLGNNLDINAPAMIEGIQAQQIAAGGLISLIRDHDDNVYVFGLNESGQLGLGDIQERNIPTLIEGIPAIKEIAAGGAGYLLLDRNGNVYEVDNHELKMIDGFRAQQISIGGHSSFIIGYKSRE